MHKKKAVFSKLFYGAALLLTAGFFIKLGIDWSQYNSSLSSAPFWVWLLMDGLYFLLPACLCAVVGTVLRRKSK